MESELTAKVQALRAHEAKCAALTHAMGVLYTDGVTVAPEESYEGRGRTMGVLSGIEYELNTDPAVLALLDELEACAPELDEQVRREVRVLRREADRIRKIPAEEYTEYARLTSEAESVWIRAKNENDFAAFAPYLEKIVKANRRMAQLWNPTEEPYNVLLDSFEEGLDMAQCEAFFTEVRSGIVPLIEKISALGACPAEFTKKCYPVAQQELLSKKLMALEGIDPKRCTLGTTEHPFTDSYNNKDVRITTHYHEEDFLSSLFSVLHEGGHALYELGGEDRINYTCLFGGASMGIHESQSRFYENIIGRSRAFAAPLLSACRECFPEQLAGVTEEEFYRGVNFVKPSLIRTEADELTYPLHVMVRYEIEKQLIAGTLEVKDVPAVWNDLYQEYLGVCPTNDAEGCLQDSHWSGGMFGYFPSYALGSAYGAQMLTVMERDVPEMWEQTAAGDLRGVTKWLHEHIHYCSALYPPKELFEKACGRFDAKYYVNYLTEKYTALYHV